MQKSTIFYITIIALLIFIIFQERCTRKSIQETPVTQVYNTYVTDTTQNNEVYITLLEEVKGLRDLLTNTPAKDVIYWETPKIEEITIEKIPDSILVYINDLEERLAISDKYLQYYPSADKLVDFQLTHDQFDITTVNIEGEMIQTKTPLYLDEYNYYWDNNSFYHLKRDKPITKLDPNIWNQLYLDVGYDLLQAAPQFGLDYSLRMGKFKVSTQPFLLFHPTGTTLHGNVRLGYRLLK